jgi:NAD(P)-dependent dehydrogenase (short-subunit alcohol dehydrogenase family)
MSRGESKSERRAQVSNKTVFGRIGHPDDVASPYLYFVFDDSGFTTGTFIRVDSGVLTHV